MRNTSTPNRMQRYQSSLLNRQEEIAQGLRNHRLVDEPLSSAPQRDVDLQRFAADSEALAEIRAALLRIADGTFGVCEECGEAISAKRLAALPWAPFCTSCQESFERSPHSRDAELRGITRLHARGRAIV